MRALALLALALPHACSDDILYSIDVRTEGALATMAGTSTLTVRGARGPLACVRDFGRANGLTGAQQQTLLDHVCANVGCAARWPNETTMPKLSDYLQDFDPDAAATHVGGDGGAAADGRAASPRSRVPTPAAAIVADPAAPRRPALPGNASLSRSVVVGERLRHELFVVDGSLDASAVAFWATELQNAPFRLRETDIRYGVEDGGGGAGLGVLERFRAWAVELDVAKVERVGGGHEVYRAVRAVVEALWPDERFELARVSGNAALYGGIYYTHADFDRAAPHVTAVYYANARWERAWAGETLFADDADDEPLHVVAPRPGRVAAFRGDIRHRVGEPSRLCELARLTFVFKFNSYVR